MNDFTEFRAVTYRLHPGTRAKHRKLVQTAGACRYVWNHFLACNRRDYATYKLRKTMFDTGLVLDKPSPPSVSFQSMGLRFTVLRLETPWLQRLPYVPVRYVLKYQAEAWKRAFAGGGFPRFKARRGDDSFTIPQNVRMRDDVLTVPKVGRVKLSRRGGNPHAGFPPVKAAHVEAVVPMYTSQTCRGCGTVDPASRKSQSEFECVHCGHKGNADVNAALNIMASATGAAGRRGALALATPRNRQHVYQRKAA